MRSRQSGLQSLQAARGATSLWSAHYRAIVEAVHPGDVPPTADVVLQRYNTRFARVPVAQTPFCSVLPQGGGTVSLYMAEGVRDNAWVAQELPRPDNSEPLPEPETWRFLHPSGILLQLDADGNCIAQYPSGATVSLGGAATASIGAAAIVLAGPAASGTATLPGPSGPPVPPGRPRPGGGYLWYLTEGGVIPSSGTLTLAFVCAVAGTAPNGSGPTGLAFPFAGITAVSGTSSGGAAAASVSIEAGAISLGGSTPVARNGDAVSVTVNGTPWSGTITSGSSVVSAG